MFTGTHCSRGGYRGGAGGHSPPLTDFEAKNVPNLINRMCFFNFKLFDFLFNGKLDFFSIQFNLKINDNKKMLLLTINLELEICKKVDLSYNIVHI